MKKTAFLVLATAVFLSCSKSSKDETRLEKSGTGVHVRIQNASGIILNELAIGETGYGNVSLAITTNYKLLSNPIYAPYCQLTVNANRRMAGYGVCGSPLPPPIAEGYYTFKVVPHPNGYYDVVMTAD